MRYLAIALALLANPFAVGAQQFPDVSAKDLNKKPVSWPRDFNTDRTVLIFAYDRDQQDMVDSWVKGLGLKTPGAAAWFEVPLINNPGKFVRSFIDNGMRRGIPTVEARAHVVTLYVKKKEFMKTMQLPDEDVHVLVLDRSGKVVSRAKGIYTATSAQSISSALAQK
jgi:hypothetical protein